MARFISTNLLTSINITDNGDGTSRIRHRWRLTLDTDIDPFHPFDINVPNPVDVNYVNNLYNRGFLQIE